MYLSHKVGNVDQTKVVTQSAVRSIIFLCYTYLKMQSFDQQTSISRRWLFDTTMRFTLSLMRSVFCLSVVQRLIKLSNFSQRCEAKHQTSMSNYEHLTIAHFINY